MPAEQFTLTLTPRQAEALRSLAAADDLPAEVYAAEVLTKHLYHAFAGGEPGQSRPAGPPGHGSGPSRPITR